MKTSVFNVLTKCIVGYPLPLSDLSTFTLGSRKVNFSVNSDFLNILYLSATIIVNLSKDLPSEG